MPNSNLDFLAPPSGEVNIPNFPVGEQGYAFPEGTYYAALGKLIPIFAEDADPATSVPIAVNNELWIIKYVKEGASEQRINLKEGAVSMGSARGVKIVERYPNPSVKPSMRWRASAFFGKFDCISEVPDPNSKDGKPQKVVDWAKVRQRYGSVFKMAIAYSTAKGGSKPYRNIQYDSIELLGQSITSDDMHKIESMYDILRQASETTTQSAPPQLKEDDLPF